MKKNSQIKKTIMAVLLAAAVMFQTLIPHPYSVFAATVTETRISMDTTSLISINTAGSVVHLYGMAGTTYSAPINVNASCTVILDNVDNTADLTVAEGVTIQLCLKGDNKINNLLATGGSQTSVYISGTSRLDTLTANDIACSTASANASSAAPTGAIVQIKTCSVTCNRLSCGDHATDKKYSNGSTWISCAPQGGNASPQVIVCSAYLTVNGNVACGGNGIYSEGTSSVTSSDGGTAGTVIIQSSTVSIAGDLSIGGKGGNGVLPWYGTGCTSGLTRSAAPVTITDHSTVTVTGNVATQQPLPDRSNNGTQSGLDGVTVSVSDSSLTAKDIASGGNGHGRIKENHTANSLGGYYHDVIGTAGGDGGKLIAKNAQITCQTAVCGASGGEYQNCNTDSDGNVTGDTAYAGHPMDGDGGIIQAENSVFAISSFAGARGTRWSNFANPSGYNNSSFLGGTLSGTIYGKLITAELPSILRGGFVASEEVRNPQEASCARCTFYTSEQQAGQTVIVKTNQLEKIAHLANNGALVTYLPIGNESIRITGTSCYFGTVQIKRAEAQNVFHLTACGTIDPSSGDIIINEDNYTVGSDDYTYNGDYTLRGTGTQSHLTVNSGTHVIRLDEVSLDTLSITGSAIVSLELTSQSSIRAINVAPDATLTVSGSGCLIADMLGNENGSNGTIDLRSGTIQVSVLGGTDGGKDILVSDAGVVSASQVNSTVRDASGAVIAGPDPDEDVTDPSENVPDPPVDVTDPSENVPDQPENVPDPPVEDNPSDSGSSDPDSSDLPPVGDTPSDHTPAGNEPNTDTPATDNSSSEDTPASGDQASTGTGQTGNSDSSGNSSSSGNSGNSGSSGNSSNSGNSGSSGAGAGSGSTTQGSGTTQSGGSTQNSTVSSKDTVNKPAASTNEAVASTASIPVRSSVKDMALIDAAVRNVYRIFTRDKVSLTVQRAEGTSYYYKIVQKGQNNSDVAWSELLTDTITTEQTNVKQRIFLKAVTADSCTIQKTPGFMVDTRAPEIKGVKGGTFYKGSRSITVQDNSGSCNVTLNGKQMDRTFTLQKRGIYLLRAADTAGNKKTVLFAIL